MLHNHHTHSDVFWRRWFYIALPARGLLVISAFQKVSQTCCYINIVIIVRSSETFVSYDIVARCFLTISDISKGLSRTCCYIGVIVMSLKTLVT